jgi:hypothetical protein
VRTEVTISDAALERLLLEHRGIFADRGTRLSLTVPSSRHKPDWGCNSPRARVHGRGRVKPRCSGGDRV